MMAVCLALPRLFIALAVSYWSLLMQTIETLKAVDDKQIAELIGMSVHWVRKDRKTKRILPFFRIGDSVRYDVETVRKVFLSRMEGGKS